jgi:cell division protein ZapA (FtsZ GTPase activity inhibitor)
MIHMGNTLESLENEYNVICDQQAKIAAQVQTVKAQLAELQRRNGELLERRHIVATLMTVMAKEKATDKFKQASYERLSSR